MPTPNISYNPKDYGLYKISLEGKDKKASMTVFEEKTNPFMKMLYRIGSLFSKTIDMKADVGYTKGHQVKVSKRRLKAFLDDAASLAGKPKKERKAWVKQALNDIKGKTLNETIQGLYPKEKK